MKMRFSAAFTYFRHVLWPVAKLSGEEFKIRVGDELLGRLVDGYRQTGSNITAPYLPFERSLYAEPRSFIKAGY